jgi:hypothetical protein
MVTELFNPSDGFQEKKAPDDAGALSLLEIND